MLKVTETQLRETINSTLDAEGQPEAMRKRVTDKVIDKCEDLTIENENSWSGHRE